ncbi:MAG: hypothetical protein HY923_05800 [Elusimicrobia bacterium]|nr:hypothetical protein [Elusimicrobiota bacterium]
MTTEKIEPRRASFKPHAFLAAFGLALAFLPSTASAAVFVNVIAGSSAPVSVDATASDVPVLTLRLTASGGTSSIGATTTLNLFGDVPSSQLSASVYRDDGDGVFSAGPDVLVDAKPFMPPGGGLPARAMLATTGEPAFGAGGARYFFTVSFNGVPPGRKLSFGFQLGADLTTADPNDLVLPLYSTATIVRVKVFANPVNGVNNFAYPVSGASSSGGLDTGLFVQAGQRVRALTVPGDLWDVSASTNADGIPPNEGLGAFSRGALVGRIGSSPWFLLGQTSTITAASAGTLYVAANDANYAGNTGFVRATFEILPSTTPKTWLGGTLGLETRADVGANWGGGKPFSGESVVFDSGAYNCDWNLAPMNLASLTVSTAFTAGVKLAQPQNQFSNRLTVDGDALIRGGTFSLGVSTNGQYNTFVVQGRLIARDTATFDMNGQNLELGIGAEISTGAVMRNALGGTVRRAIPSLPWYLKVYRATVSVSGAQTSFDGIDYLDFNDAVVLAFDNINFNTLGTQSNPYATFATTAKVDYAFNKWLGGPSSRNPSVIATSVFPGSTITFNNSTAIGGSTFGSPKTVDPGNVVKWVPDGGGPSGFITGVLSAAPGDFGTYLLVASTSPKGGNDTGLGGGVSLSTTLSGSPRPYTMSGLRAPGTYYVFAYIDDGSGGVGAHSPRGGFGRDGEFRSDPVFVPSGGASGPVNFQARPWGAVNGYVDNNSAQIGPILVETWSDTPGVAFSTRQARGQSFPGSGYVFQTYADFLGVKKSSVVFAFVDANLNGFWDVFEASATAGGVGVASLSTTTVNLSIFGGNAAPGGAASVSSAAVHFGAVASQDPQALLRLRLTAAVSTAAVAAVKLRYLGTPPPGSVGLSVWADEGDGAFSSGDTQLGVSYVFSGGPSTTSVQFSSGAILQPGVPRDFFVAVDLAGMSVSTAGVMIDAATSFTLAAGTFSVTPAFPIQVAALPVFKGVRASDYAAPELAGGLPTGFFTSPGQQLYVASTGTWRTGPGDAPTGPGGAPGTTGLNTVLPAANRGELIGRVLGGGGYSSQWFRIGASTSIPAPNGGELRLAINDFVGAYYDNSGVVLATFSVSGSTLGALSGTISYPSPLAGSTMTVTARRYGTVPTLSTTVVVTASTIYGYFIDGLLPGSYDVSITNSLNADFGRSNQEANVAAGSITGLDATMFKSTGSITGMIFYSGVVGSGDFRIGVATVTDFSGDVHFFGGVSTPVAGVYTASELPTPATYYLISFRDGNGSGGPDGPEPIGYYGIPGAGVFTLSSSMTPVFVGAGVSSAGVNVTLFDQGGIEGSAVLQPGATGTLVVETGKGVPGTFGYATENRAKIALPGGGPPPTGLFYRLSLLRPATGYSLFAFLDKNSDGLPTGGEEQFAAAAAINVPTGGIARFDFSMATLTAPAAPAVFTAVSAPVSTITFSWNLVPGATGYQLRRANNSIFTSLGAAASNYFDVLPDNTSSQIRSITASNGNGTSTTTALAGPVFTLAAIPTTPVVSAVSSTGALVSWGGTNAPGTVFELNRATAAALASAGTRVYLGTGTSVFNPLSPASTYFWAVRALNGNNAGTSYTGVVTTVTPTLAGPALYGFLSYAGGQTAGGRGFAIEASTSSTTFFPRASSAALPGAALQPWYLPVAAGTYFVRAYVDLAGTGVLQTVADTGSVGSFVVGASSVNAAVLIVSSDTVPPGAPAGLLAVPGANKVTVSWVAPTKNANGTNLIDLAGYKVERSTALTAAFVVLTPVALSSSASSFVDNFPLPGGVGLYRVRSVDLGGNLSAPSGVVSAAASAGGSISGVIRNFSAYTGASGGTFHVRLSTLPFVSAASVSEASLTTYTFTGLADGVYFLRAYRDLNGNSIEDSLTEPSGTFGGLNQPFPISIINANAVSGADATICDRSPLQPPAVGGSILAGGCPALDKGPGFTTNLFAFKVGGGGANSFGVGTQINLAMSTATAFETDLFLLGPNGSVFGRDNRVGGANLTVTLSQPGVYLVEPTSFKVGGGGAFQLNARLEGGFAGVISGSVTYAGLQPGIVYTQLFNSSSQQSLPILTSTAAGIPASFSFAGLPDGNYFIRSFRDSNGNGVRDGGDPAGQFGVSASSTLPVNVAGGFASGAPFIVPISDPAVGVVRGAALYEGSGSGVLRIEVGLPFCPNCGGEISTVVSFTTVAPGGVYNLPFIPAATNYIVRAIADFNSNGRQDALEPAISSYPVSVYVNATSTVSLIVRDGGAGAFGGAVVLGTASYSGASTGPVVIGLSRDPQFRSIDYLIVLPATGPFQRAGLEGGATYYMAGFIDTNLNNNPDEDLGEPAAAGSTVPFSFTPTLDSPPEIFVAVTGPTTVQLLLYDPPNGSVRGTVSYTGSAPAVQNLVVRASRVSGFESKEHLAVIFRAPGVSTYSFRLDFLKADDYYVSAFIDANNNRREDNGEPFGSRPPVSVSSGAGSFPSYGANVDLLDPGSLGAALSAGRIHGELVYLGTQGGPVYVRFFNNEFFSGTPLYTQRLPASGMPPAGSGEFLFDRQNLPFGTYYLDAFRDPSDSGFYNPAAHAHGVLNGGQGVEVSQQQPNQYAFGGSISDPGMGGSVDAFTGNFAAPGGARFDGGATDLGVLVTIDSFTAPSPQVITLGITKQNDGDDIVAVRYSSAGVMLSSAVLFVGDLQVNSLTVDEFGTLYVPERFETPNSSNSTMTLTAYDTAFGFQNSAVFPGYQGFDGLSYSTVPGNQYLFAATRYTSNSEIRALKIDPATLLTAATGYFPNPTSCGFCQSRVLGGTLSPDGRLFVVYAAVNQQTDGGPGLHFLLAFDAAGAMGLLASREVTSLGAPAGGAGGGINMAIGNSGALYIAFTVGNDTARTFKFDVDPLAGTITQTGEIAYGPIKVHFGGGLHNISLDHGTDDLFEVWESTTGGGDYMLLRYDPYLNLVGQRFYDGFNNSLEDTAFSVGVYNSSQVYVAGSVNNGSNLDWGTLRLNGNVGGATSAAGSPVAITTSNGVNFIAGTVSYGGSLITSGTIRTSLIPYYGDVPIRFATAPFSASAPFLFNNIPDGLYDIVSFIDPNGNLNADEGEPTGASTLYGVEFAAVSGSRQLADPVQLCDRRQIAFDVDVLHSLTATDCTSPDREGAPRRLYTFRGTRGQPVTIAMNAIGFYDSYLDLYGPDGDWLEYDDDGGGDGDARIVNYILPEDGVYTIDAGAYASGSFGSFRLSLSGSLGALGGINGRVNYSGSQGGAVIVGLFDAPAFSSTTNVGRMVLTSTRSFAFENLAVGTTYYLGAFIDVNANNAPDAGEDGGVFGLSGVPNPVYLAPGQVAAGVEIAVFPSTTSAASAAYVTGAASYAGARTGSLVLEFWSSSQFNGHPIASRQVPTGVGSYDTAVPGGVPYYVRAFLDVNGDFALQPDEPRGVYAPNGQGAEQLFAPVGQTLVGVDITLKDPGVTASGVVAGEGTAVLTSTYAVSGQVQSVTVVYTAGATGLAGTGSGTPGRVGFTVPPGFPFPVASASGSSVTATSTGTALSAVTYSGPSAFVTVAGAGGLLPGQTVRFEWTNFYAPCAVGAATFTVSAVEKNTESPQPLFLGSPNLAVVTGAPTYASLDEPYFAVKVGEFSEVRRVVVYDNCGAKVPVAAATTIDLAARFFNGSVFVSEPEVGVATSTVLSTEAVVALGFAVGQSSQPFYVLAASTGFKYLEVHSTLGLAPGSTYYFGVSAVPANALTNVTVSSATGGVALSSASIGLASNGQPNSVFVNFLLGDPQQSWHVLVSSLPFKAGERPAAVWERWGFGQPNKGELAWDGRFSPWIAGGGRVPNGLYYVRVELGGGGVKDDTIRVTVSLPQFSGRAFDSGTSPYPPLSVLQLRVYGPSGYYTATTDSNGDYVLPGLGAGNYRLNVARPDFVDGAVDMTLNVAGAATSFIARSLGVLVSSNATGGLDLFVSRAPRLIVVPSLDASVAAAASDQWGSLQVRPSTSVSQQSTFYGPMRLQGGATTFDDGGQWDSSTQQFVTRTLLGFNVPVGTYSVVGDLYGYSRSTGSVYVGPEGARLDLTPFLPKAVITGHVNLAGAAPAGGLSVGITGIALSTSIATTGLSGGTFISAGSTYAVYSISGFDPGGYLLRANTQGLSSITTGPIVVAGTAAVTGVDFPNFPAGAALSGTISVVAPNGTPIFINAWSPGSFNFGSTVVYVAANSAAYSLPGLDAGATYQLYANIDAQGGDYDLTSPAGGFPIKLFPPDAAAGFTLSPASGVVSGTILLRAGATDFVNVTINGVTIASLRPGEVGKTFVDISTRLPNFLCGDGSSANAAGYCPAGVSSATFKVHGVNTETLDIRFLHSTTGQSTRQTISVVNGSTFSFVADLSASTFSISGTVLNQITDTLFNTSAKILANAPYIAPQGYPAGLSSTTARVIAIRQDIDQFGVAISTVFDPVSSRVGFLDASGNFTIPNCPNGAYIVRTADLRSCSTCAIIAPSVGRSVRVAGAAVSSVTLTVSNGYTVSGTISLDGGLQDARVFDVSVYNRRQELVRSTVAYLGDVNLGQMSGSVDYAFPSLPAGEFYTLVVRGLLFPVKYVGRPVKFPDPALSPSGLQSNLIRQDVTMLRAAYATGRLKDGSTGELFTASNATLLAPNFRITATANPWTEGGFVLAASSMSGRPIEGDGYFRVGPLLPSVSYDLRFAQTSWDPNFLSNGSQNYAPSTLGGVKLTAGEIRDVGIIALGQGLSVTGVVKSTATGLPLGNLKVVAKPSFGGDEDLVVQTFTNSQGLYTVWVSSLVSNQFTVTAAPRGGNLASDGKYYGQATVSNINLQTQTSANFLLNPLSVVVTGQVVVADAATGGALSYPFGDKRGFPAAAVNLQLSGTVSNNPLGDVEVTSDERGFFSVPGLSTGLYTLHATSLGYAVFNATAQVIGSTFHIFTGSNTASNDLPGGVLTLARGATATGRILKSDGSSPNSTEVVGVAAANFGAGEFVVGSVQVDPLAKTVDAYTISGFKPGIAYNIVLLSGSRGKEVSFPPEGAGVVFGASESTTTKTINLTYKPAALDCLGTAKALDAARSQFSVQIDCLKPMRQETAADDDLTQILTVSTFTSAGAGFTAPNGTGVLSARALSSDRRRLTGVYTLAASETRFTMRVRAAASELDPTTGDSFRIDKVFDFYAGLDASADGRATNIDGGEVSMQPSSQDELLGLDERSRIDLPPGCFGEGSDSLADSGVVANPTTTVNVSMTKGRDQTLAKALSIAAVGYAPAALSVPDVPSAFPTEMWAAMSKYRASAASTSTVGGANPLSAFYSIFLPAGIRHQLKQRADLTLSYSLATSTGTTDDKIQVWFYNAVLGRFVPETVNRRLDAVNKTITVSVDHFSTFVVLDSTPVATSGVTFGGADIAVANFPNPADCITHSNIAQNATLFGAGGTHAPFAGTMIRTSIPGASDTAPLKINIYTVTGEKVRTIEQGDLPGGKTYYTPWNCLNDGGRTVASGVYIGEAVHGGKRKFFKIAIIKGSGL